MIRKSLVAHLGFPDDLLANATPAARPKLLAVDLWSLNFGLSKLKGLGLPCALLDSLGALWALLGLSVESVGLSGASPWPLSASLFASIEALFTLLESLLGLPCGASGAKKRQDSNQVPQDSTKSRPRCPKRLLKGTPKPYIILHVSFGVRFLDSLRSLPFGGFLGCVGPEKTTILYRTSFKPLLLPNHATEQKAMTKI